MKPDATETGSAAPRVWQGLDEYMDSQAFRDAMRDEFPEDAAEWTNPVSRRTFVSLMGASLALAGAGCSVRPAPQRKIVPYTQQPDQITPGVPLHFATAAPLAGFVTGVLVRSNEGRPTKVEGNPDHPASLGSADLFALASVLDLYDPDRSATVLHDGIPSSYTEAAQALRKEVEKQKGKRGAGVRILTSTTTSPTLADHLEILLKDLPEAKWVQYDATGRDNVREGARKAFGKYLNPVYDFTKADVVLALDSDFVNEGPGRVRYARDLAARRKVRKDSRDGNKPDTMARLYAAECMPSSVGSVADHRLALTPSQVESFARAVAAELKVPGAPAAGTLPDAARAWVAPLAKDLDAHKGACLVVAGEAQPPAVHALAHAINSHLGNVGKTVHFTAPVEVRPSNQLADLKALTDDMAAGKVEVLLMLSPANPAYTAPADVDFAGAAKKVPFKFHLGPQSDETATLCEWHVPEAHYLEAWGDGRAFDGTASVQQPLIAPLTGGKSAIEVVADLTNNPIREGLELVRATWMKWHGQAKKDAKDAAFEPYWQESVRSGVLAGTAFPRETVALAGNWAEGSAAPAATGGDFEINFRLDPTLFDGRYANNGWLQELPKPITKMTWDNAAYVSPATAQKLLALKEFRWTAGERGRTEVSVIELEYKGRKVKAPVWPLPGHPDGAVTVHLGCGRERVGRVGNVPSQPNADGKPVRGFNAFALRTLAAPWFDGGLKLTKTSADYILACVQGHWVTVGTPDPISGKPLDRNPVRWGTLELYKKNPEFPKMPPTAQGEWELINENVPGNVLKGHSHNGDSHDHGEEHDKRLHPLTMYLDNTNLSPNKNLEQLRKWGMAIDLTVCTGCNACMVACQGENNIPVVGKFEVTRAHEMHWIRVDRYYEGDPMNAAKVKTTFQPVPCQQCEKAPCEVVCPVGATVHSVDGLNDMAYNRCVGTRYCSNNCPYKVRRFNFLTFQDWTTTSLKLGRNPDVSVRSRGVMEKCTYCVQRIRGAEIVAEREARKIKDGEVVTACQAACPSAAIMFGDMLDDASVIKRWKAEPTNYGLLAELNTMPRTTYLGTVRNVNPDMPKGA